MNHINTDYFKWWPCHKLYVLYIVNAYTVCMTGQGTGNQITLTVTDHTVHNWQSALPKCNLSLKPQSETKLKHSKWLNTFDKNVTCQKYITHTHTWLNVLKWSSLKMASRSSTSTQPVALSSITSWSRSEGESQLESDDCRQVRTQISECVQHHFVVHVGVITLEKAVILCLLSFLNLLCSLSCIKLL